LREPESRFLKFIWILILVCAFVPKHYGLKEKACTTQRKRKCVCV